MKSQKKRKTASTKTPQRDAKRRNSTENSENIVNQSKITRFFGTNSAENSFVSLCSSEESSSKPSLSRNSSFSESIQVIDLTEPDSTEPSSPPPPPPPPRQQQPVVGSLVQTKSERSTEAEESHQNVDLREISLSQSTQRSTQLASSPSTLFDENKVPFYLQNFTTILLEIETCDFIERLFSGEERATFKRFFEASVPAQKLYVRLFQRKPQWFRVEGVKYADIADDMTPLFEELVEKGLARAGADLQDIEEIFDLLSAPEVKTLAREFRLDGSQSKSALIQSLQKLGSEQKSVVDFFVQKRDTKLAGKSNNLIESIVRRAKTMVGPIFRLIEDGVSVFARMLILYSPMHSSGMAGGKELPPGQLQLSLEVQVRIGQVQYPQFEIRRGDLFPHRESLIAYERALRLAAAITATTDLEKCLDVLQEARELFDQLEQSASMQYEARLPRTLRPFTAGAILVRLLAYGTELLEKARRFDDAVALLETLLGQEVHRLHKRAVWWNRLALDFERHLRSPSKAKDALRRACLDPHVMVHASSRLLLWQRAARLAARDKQLLSELSPLRFESEGIPEISIDGKLLPGCVSVFMEGETVLRVEQVALQHYVSNGYEDGIHGEGSTLSTIVGLFLWDLLFLPGVANTFISPFQSCPLDLFCNEFYDNRKELIDEKLKQIRASSHDDLCVELEKIWNEHNGEMCSLVSWSRFTDFDQLKGLVQCFPLDALAALIQLFCQQYRYCRSGVPDLCLWNATTKSLLFSEVKGPGDRLSHKQIVWLDTFLKLGIKAEVCYVKGINRKRFQRTISSEEERPATQEASEGN